VDAVDAGAGGPFSELLDALALERGECEALVCGDRILTFRDVRATVHALAAALRADGLNHHDIVGLAVADEIDHFVMCLALWTLGATHFTLASHDAQQMHEQLMQRTGSTKVIDAAMTHRVLRGISGTVPTAALPLAEGTMILKTSGTVSRAKLVPISHGSLIEQARQHDFYVGSRLLRFASVEHNNSKRHRLYCFLVGGTNVFRHSQVDSMTTQYLVDSTCTRVDLARAHVASLLEASERRKLDPGIAVSVAGSPLPAELRRRFLDSVTDNLSVRYGATETGTISVAGPGDHGREGSVGRPLPRVSVEVDADSHLIKVKTPGMATRYWDEPSAQGASFSDDWFIPGDLGRFEPDGTLLVTARGADVFTFDGVNIYPHEIEAVLSEHADIAEVAVAKRLSDVHDGIPIAFVKERAGRSLKEYEVLMWARHRMGLAGPRQVIVVSELPYTDQGKIDRQALQRWTTPVGPPVDND